MNASKAKIQKLLTNMTSKRHNYYSERRRVNKIIQDEYLLPSAYCSLCRVDVVVVATATFLTVVLVIAIVIVSLIGVEKIM